MLDRNDEDEEPEGWAVPTGWAPLACYSREVVMAAPLHRTEYSLAEYLTLENASNVKHEYLAGQIYAMAGGTPDHAALATTAAAVLFSQLRSGRCRAFDSDLRVRVRATGLSTYPDVTVVCGPRELDTEDTKAVTNPTLLLEVLSASTESYDRGDKFDHYRQLPTLREYVLVSQTERRVEVFTRTADAEWTSRAYGAGERVSLASIDAAIDVDELYEAAAEPKE
jgi:Uma2 family endonuclease